MPYPSYSGQVINTAICWRSGCKTAVDNHDELGLCKTCIEEMRNDSYSHELTEYEKPIPVDRDRSV